CPDKTNTSPSSGRVFFGSSAATPGWAGTSATTISNTACIDSTPLQPVFIVHRINYAEFADRGTVMCPIVRTAIAILRTACLARQYRRVHYKMTNAWNDFGRLGHTRSAL